MAERRSHQRNRVLFAGKTVFNFGQSTLDCTVSNLSDEGACVMVGPCGTPWCVSFDDVGTSSTALLQDRLAIRQSRWSILRSARGEASVEQ